MTIRRVRIWLSRGWYRTLCSISLLLLPLFCNTGRAFAAISHVQQDTIKSAVVVSGTKPQAGDIISGTICDENGPMQLVNITERDSLYRIVAHAVSDVNGKFAFKLVNPANRLSVTYVGYGEAITAITGTSFDITMVELPDLPVVDLSGDAKRVTMYGPPAVNYNRYYDPNAQPAVRDFIEIGARTPDVSVMYGVPVNRLSVSDNPQTAKVLEDGTITVDGKKITRLNYKIPNTSVADTTVTVDENELKQETRAISPKDRRLVTNENYLAQLLEYAPEGLVCGYIMRNSWRKNLWGIFLIKEKKQYSLVYKEEDKVQKRKIKSDQATILEASVNTQISKIEFDINNPVFTEVYGGSLEIGMVYDGDIVFAVTPSKAAHFRALNGHQYNGINDEYWQAEVDQFKQKTK